jgi:hypothetical protein
LYVVQKNSCPSTPVSTFISVNVPLESVSEVWPETAALTDTAILKPHHK